MGRLRRLIAAVSVLLGVGLLAASPAAANDAAYAVVYNYTNHSGSNPVGVGVDFHTSTGAWAYQVVGAGSWQGEISGNKYYEPRDFRVGTNWCVMYAIQFWGQAKGADTWVCGGAYGVTRNVYFGDGNTKSYDILLETGFYRGY
jgi:hypothetical protein